MSIESWKLTKPRNRGKAVYKWTVFFGLFNVSLVSQRDDSLLSNQEKY